MEDSKSKKSINNADRCIAFTEKGERCKNKNDLESEYCARHNPKLIESNKEKKINKLSPNDPKPKVKKEIKEVSSVKKEIKELSPEKETKVKKDLANETKQDIKNRKEKEKKDIKIKKSIDNAKKLLDKIVIE